MIQTKTKFESIDCELDLVIQAQKKYATFSQQQVNVIFKKAAMAANEARVPLAIQAVEETGMGVVADKVIKNHFASEIIYHKYHDLKTCGVVESDPLFGYEKVAKPIGVVAGFTPVTNPSSTAIFKALICLLTRNGFIVCPHPKAEQCTIDALRIVRDAAIEAGAPKNIIGWVSDSNIEKSQYLMQHKKVDLLLATGGGGMVSCAYSSGTPSLGVGAGDTPILVTELADVESAVSSIILSKTFDNGVICASEQVIFVEDEIYDQVKAEFHKRGAYLLSPQEKKKVEKYLFKEDGKINAAAAGKSVKHIVNHCGIQVPSGTRLLVGEIKKTGKDEAFSREKLSPVLGLMKVGDFDDGLFHAAKLVDFAGSGHTAVLYTDQDSKEGEEQISRFGETMKAGRLLVNTPASQGAIGDLYNFKLEPSLTLGCGSWGKNSFCGNVGPKNLLNMVTLAKRQENTQWYKVPKEIYFKRGSLDVGLEELQKENRKRALIITDNPIFQLGMVRPVQEKLHSLGITTKIISDVKPNPDLHTIKKGLEQANSFQPDVIVAFGGGSPMDAAKIIWLQYEQPDISFDGVSMTFMDIQKRIYEIPKLGKKAVLVAIPTTSGTGSEVTPFAVVTDEEEGVKYPLADYTLTPTMAIIDANLIDDMPKTLTAYSGIDAMTHSLEAYVSSFATPFTDPHALKAIKMLFDHLPAAYDYGKDAPKSREKVHEAATIAGMAFANAFLGICHSMAHKLGAEYDIPHGLANALMLSYVMRYNATDKPFKQASFSQYPYPKARQRYAEIIDFLDRGCSLSENEKVDMLISEVEELKRRIGIPKSIREYLGKKVTEKQYLSKLDEVAQMSFDDQCTGTNPRYPLIVELKQLLKDAYYGNPTFKSDEAMEESMEKARSEAEKD
jgi:acetaldehyde dehydrogenase/alcohol dehydrogenase